MASVKSAGKNYIWVIVQSLIAYLNFVSELRIIHVQYLSISLICGTLLCQPYTLFNLR